MSEVSIEHYANKRACFWAESRAGLMEKMIEPKTITVHLGNYDIDYCNRIGEFENIGQIPPILPLYIPESGGLSYEDRLEKPQGNS